MTPIDGWSFEFGAARKALLEQLRAGALEGFGLDGHPAATAAAGALVHHLRDTQKVDLAHVRSVVYRQRADALLIDPTTLKHLEILEGSEGGRSGSLLDELDRTVTSIGSRLLRAWLLRPLVALEPIRDRLDAVEELAFHNTERGKFRDAIKAVQDLERLVARAALGTAGPRDLVGLKHSLAVIPRLRTVLTDLQAPLVRSLLAELDDLDRRPGPDRVDADRRTRRPGPRRRLRPRRRRPRARRAARHQPIGQAIHRRDGRRRARPHRHQLAEDPLQPRLRLLHRDLEVEPARGAGRLSAQADHRRRRALHHTGAEGYEEKVLGADERILERELEIFERLRTAVAAESPRIQATARALATLDVLAALAESAAVNNYIKPQMHDGDEMTVLESRHPVVERRTTADAFVPNDVSLNASTCQLVILTGPNMGGKSTYLRQTALLCVMAQAGSFVPAREAKIPLVDRIYARVGASDNIARGHSTFMVEMQETANILHTATSRSLVVLDEIGRGTATFDGLSIAWAVAEFLATNAKVRPKTLFATHYHELTDLADATPGVVNYHVSAREWKDDIIFLRKIVPGRSDRSYGIQVARLAGLPASVIARAREILGALERDELTRGGRPSVSGTASDPQRQLGLFQAAAPDDGLRKTIAALDVDHMTPMAALTLLAELKSTL